MTRTRPTCKGLELNKPRQAGHVSIMKRNLFLKQAIGDKKSVSRPRKLYKGGISETEVRLTEERQ